MKSFDPQSGGTKISENNKWMFRQQTEKFTKDRPWSSEYELIVRFKSQFCYLDALKKAEANHFQSKSIQSDPIDFPLIYWRLKINV